MRTKFKPWTVEFLNDHKGVNLLVDDLSDFDFSKPTFLEIGSGKGMFLTMLALKNPNKQFIGIEKNITCAGITCRKLVESEVKNAFIVGEDVEKIFPVIKDETIEGLFLNFSDPWPKKRHAKRRLTSDRFIDNYYRILKQGGHFYFKTDNKELFDYTVKVLSLDKRLEMLKIDENYDGKIEFDTMTEYEKSFRDLGQSIYRLDAIKR